MAKKKSGKGAMIFGSVLGAVAGAAYAMWKTPMSGAELRGRLRMGPVSQGSTTTTPTGTYKPGFTDKVMGVVEKAAAPIVGVELGKTANGSTGNAVVSAPIVPATETEIETLNVEQAETVVPTVNYNTDSIRSKRFSWGEPKPDVTAPTESTVVVNERVEETDSKAYVAPAAQDMPAASNYGSTTIRAQRFGWGEPAPATDGESVTTERVAMVDATETSPLVQATAVDAALSPEAQDAVASGKSNMHTFPKLGGLE